MNRDERLLRLTIQRYIAWKTKPPTFASVLLAWQPLPPLAIAGVTSVLLLRAVGAPSEITLGVAGIYLGAAAVIIGIALGSVRVWRIRRELLDWQKIDTLARELRI